MNLLILGTGGHARALIDAAISFGEEPLGLIDTNFKNQKETILGVDILGGFEVLELYDHKETSIAIAIGDNHKREKIYLRLKQIGLKIATIIHPTAIISKYAVVGEGVFINSGVIVNAEATIGDNCIINTGVIVEHEVKIENHCHLAPGVKIGGRSSIDKKSFVGIGTSIADYITIGHDVIIGAGSVIVKDVRANATVVGIGREI